MVTFTNAVTGSLVSVVDAGSTDDAGVQPADADTPAHRAAIHHRFR
jgi:hypothetical protein